MREMTIRKQGGLTLVEVLVVLVIMAIGLMGIAGLQATGVRQTTGAGFKTQAMFLAQDMIERIRANRVAILPNEDSLINLAPYAKTSGGAFPTAAVAACKTAVGCTPAEMAQSDLFEWEQAIRHSLPVTNDEITDDTYICLDSDPTDATVCDGLGSTVLIRLAWLDNTLQTDAAGDLSQADRVHTYQITFEP